VIKLAEQAGRGSCEFTLEGFLCDTPVAIDIDRLRAEWAATAAASKATAEAVSLSTGAERAEALRQRFQLPAGRSGAERAEELRKRFGLSVETDGAASEHPEPPQAA